MLTVSNNGDNPIIALEQMYFQQGRLTLGKLCISPQKGHPRTPMITRALIWPGHLAPVQRLLIFLDYISIRVCQSLLDSFL